jgi:hypothetical protein
MGSSISLPKSELISLGLTTFLYGEPMNPTFFSLAFLLDDDDGLSVNRIVLRSVSHHGGDIILSESVCASTPHKDPPSVILDASGGHYGASTFYQARSFDQVPTLLSL